MPSSNVSEARLDPTTPELALIPIMPPLNSHQATSKSWKSTAAKKREVKRRAQRLKVHQGSSLLRTEDEKFKHFHAQRAYLGLQESPFVPQNLPEWIEHQSSCREAELVVAKQKLLFCKSEFLIGPAMDGKTFKTCHSAVLACRSVFSPAALTDTDDGAPPLAEWPSEQEFKFEGNDRHATGFGRFLPLSRTTHKDEYLSIFQTVFDKKPVWNGVGRAPWYERELKVPYPMDTMRRLEDMHGERMEVEEDIAKELINSDLWGIIK